MYTVLMSDEGRKAEIAFDFGGVIANSLNAHRILQHYQMPPAGSPERANLILNCNDLSGELVRYCVADDHPPALYEQYFERRAHPAADGTLVKAATDAGVPEEAVRALLADATDGLPEVRQLLREQASNGVDGVPHIQIEGKKRDLTLVGAKEVEEYERALRQIVKEST